MGHNQTEIARVICVHKSTVSREYRRNRDQRGYRPKQAHLMEVDFRLATLTKANLKSASLLLADLSGAKGVTDKQLSKTKSLDGTKLPDGSKFKTDA